MPSQNRTPLPHPVHGVYVRNVLQSCGGHFAVAWAEAEPLPDGHHDGHADGFTSDGFAFVNAVPPVGPRRERLSDKLAAAFAEGVRLAWAPGGGARPELTALVRLVDARWHEMDSTPRSFRMTGELAALEISRCVTEGQDPRPVLRSSRQPYLPWERSLVGVRSD